MRYEFGIDGDSYKDGTYEVKKYLTYTTVHKNSRSFHRELLNTYKCKIICNDEVINEDLYHNYDTERPERYKVFEVSLI